MSFGINTGIFSTSLFVINFTIEPEERDLKEFILYRLAKYNRPKYFLSGVRTYVL